MGHTKDFHTRIRGGGDDAIAALEELLNTRDSVLKVILDTFAAQRWIPIEDCSPTPSEIGLVWDGQAISFAWCKDGETPFSVEDAVARGITHWMPLPAPPAS